MAIHLTNSNAAVIKHLIRSNCFQSRKQNTNTGMWSHISLDGFNGGLISVKQGDLGAFQDAYIESLTQDGKPDVVFLNEFRAEPYFRFNLDVDKSIENMDDSQLLALCQGIHRALTAAYKDAMNDLFDMIVLRPVDPKTRVPLPGSSLHITFIRLTTSDQRALDLRRILVDYFAFATRSNTVNGKKWEDVFDQAIYISNGVRLPGAHKCDTCPTCEGKVVDSAPPCTECLGAKRVDRGRPYWFSHYYSGEDMGFDVKLEEIYHSDVGRVIRDSSIRQTMLRETEGFSIPDGTILGDSAQAMTEKLRRLIGTTNLTDPKKFERVVAMCTSKLPERKEKGEGAQKIFTFEIVRANPMYEVLDGVVRNYCVPFYREVCITTIMANDTRSCFKIKVSGRGSRVCFNVKKPNKQHSKSGVYFIVCRKGISQRCMSNKKTTVDRCVGECSSFQHTFMPLAQREKDLLFKCLVPMSGPRFDRSAVDFAANVTLCHQLRSTDRYLLWLDQIPLAKRLPKEKKRKAVEVEIPEVDADSPSEA
jgi:hypothetical protein